MLKFQKYQATGNDFIICNDWENTLHLELDFIRKVCHRKFGIGSDGFIQIKSHPDYDFEMIFFNPDGSQSFCGNGSRAALKFCTDNRLLPEKKEYTFLAIDGPHQGNITPRQIEIKMKDVGRWKILGEDMEIDTGSPHYMHFISDIRNFDIISYGKSIRYSNTYKEDGINVNALELMNDALHVRTYERGVENETLSCGTGVTASALAANIKHDLPSPVAIQSQGGKLEIRFKKTLNGFEDIFLCGPAKFVFKGEIAL